MVARRAARQLAQCRRGRTAIGCEVDERQPGPMGRVAYSRTAAAACRASSADSKARPHAILGFSRQARWLQIHHHQRDRAFRRLKGAQIRAQRRRSALGGARCRGRAASGSDIKPAPLGSIEHAWPYVRAGVLGRRHSPAASIRRSDALATHSAPVSAARRRHTASTDTSLVRPPVAVWTAGSCAVTEAMARAFPRQAVHANRRCRWSIARARRSGHTPTRRAQAIAEPLRRARCGPLLRASLVPSFTPLCARGVRVACSTQRATKSGFFFPPPPPIERPPTAARGAGHFGRRVCLRQGIHGGVALGPGPSRSLCLVLRPAPSRACCRVSARAREPVPPLPARCRWQSSSSARSCAGPRVHEPLAFARPRLADCSGCRLQV